MSQPSARSAAEQPAQPTTSREAYADAVAKLEAYAAKAKPEAVAGVADEIFAVARLLAEQIRLRRALSDPARSGPQRADLLRELLTGKVSDTALELVGALVAGRWSSGAELVNTTERLLVETYLVAAERAGELAEVEDELFRFGQVVDGDRRLGLAISDSTVPAQRRTELATLLLEGKARTATIALVKLAVYGFGGRNFATGLTRLVELTAARREREVAYVTVAAPISDQDEQRLGAALAHLYGREVSMKVTVDPEILGGISVRVGSDLYDGTVARRLAETRNALTTH